MTLRAILFDFDGTLRLNQREPAATFAGFLDEIGWPVGDEDFRRAARWEQYYWAQSPELLADIERYEFGSQAFWKNYAKRRLAAYGLGQPLAAELAEAASEYMGTRYQYASRLPEGALETLHALQEAGLALGVLSNRREDYRQEIAELGLADFFRFAIAAGDLQHWKPDPQPFHEALRQAEARPEESLYIGDNYFADVVGARRVGMKAVLFNARGLYEAPGCPTFTSFPELLPLLRREYGLGA